MVEMELQMTDLYAVHQEQEQPAGNVHEDGLKGEDCKKQKLKVPRRILHFSDGTLEEYSTDEEDETDNRPDTLALVDPKSLRWGPWLYYWMLYTGTSALSACDYVGEGLANVLGITSPKYQYEIDEYKRCEEEEKAEREETAAEIAGWMTTEAASIVDGAQPKIVVSPAIQQPPSPSHAKNQHDTHLLREKSSEMAEASCHATSNSCSPSLDTSKVKVWMSKIMPMPQDIPDHKDEAPQKKAANDLSQCQRF
ncbi:protein FAM177A1 isoform X2 [Procambarus clarkii]|uniref:protein FAM177A1 isoform X2 n=1 Tax=Procambarus clarkii TaxID=6728 RepID=UPI003741FBDB